MILLQILLLLQKSFNIPFTFVIITENFSSAKDSLQNRALGDIDLLLVARHMTRELDIYTVGLRLGLQHQEIEGSLKNHRDEITMAAYHMLRTWLIQHNDRKLAFSLLVTALKEAKLQNIVDEVLYQK